MKILNYILVGFISLLCWQCNDEDALNAELGSYRRTYDVNSPDTVVRFVSQYYNKYGRVFITDPDSSDYMYNFQYKNSFYMGMPEQTTEHLLYGISMMKELFLDAYTDECIKNHFPFSLIISDSIKQTDFPYNQKDFYIARNYIALNVGNFTKDYDFKQLSDLSFQLHIGFITTLLYQHQNCLDLATFFAHGEKLYNTRTTDIWPEEKIWAAGFLYDQESHGGWFGSDYSSFSNQKQDLEDYLSFLLGYRKKYSKIPTNVEELLATYPVIKQKYDALIQALKEVGIDYKKLVYK